MPNDTVVKLVKDARAMARNSPVFTRDSLIEMIVALCDHIESGKDIEVVDDPNEVYYICDTCAKERGWSPVEGHQCTIHRGECDACHTSQMLTAKTDWHPHYRAATWG